MDFGIVLGTIVGILVAGAVYKLFPEQDLNFLLAAIVGVGAFLGLLLDWTDSPRRPRK